MKKLTVIFLLLFSIFCLKKQVLSLAIISVVGIIFILIPVNENTISGRIIGLRKITSKKSIIRLKISNDLNDRSNYKKILVSNECLNDIKLYNMVEVKIASLRICTSLRLMPEI
jgi:hypothetical protein